MAMREQTSVRFKISSLTLSAKDIAARTGLTPDESWKIGDARGAFGNVEKRHGFVLESKAMMQATLDDHIKAMLKRLAPHAQNIGAIAAETTIEFVCIVHRNVAPMLHFERDDIRWLGVMGAKLDVDIFIIDEAKTKAKYSSPAAPATGGGTGETAPPAAGSGPSF
jgi:hypothetical protein